MTFGGFYGTIKLSQPGKERLTMGMTDSQFKAFLRFVLDDLQEARAEENVEKRNLKLDKIIDTMQKALED